MWGLQGERIAVREVVLRMGQENVLCFSNKLDHGACGPHKTLARIIRRCVDPDARGTGLMVHRLRFQLQISMDCMGYWTQSSTTACTQ